MRLATDAHEVAVLEVTTEKASRQVPSTGFASGIRFPKKVIRKLSALSLSPTPQRISPLLARALDHSRRGESIAQQLLDEALELAQAVADPNHVGRVAAARAENAWYRGDLECVLREAAMGLSCACGVACGCDLASPWIRGELCYWRSRAAGEVVNGFSTPADIAEPWRLMVAGEWEDAASAWEQLGMAYEQALALTDGGEAALRRALQILNRVGRGPLSMFARRKLRQLGVRDVPRGPNKTTRENPSGLTAREVEVLQLLTHGYTNAQLAQRLHRSPKTIGHHVSALLGKLGVQSRTAAVAAGYMRGILRPSTEA
jgi:DNA-binding CsgD family transcriptional regulator